MIKNLQDLLEAAKNLVLTPEEKEQQRRSFAYGNTVIENPRVTCEMIDWAADDSNSSRCWPKSRFPFDSFAPLSHSGQALYSAA